MRAMPRLRWRTAAALLALALLAACSAPMEFTSPLGEPGSVEIDTRLVGTWYGISRCRHVGEGSPCAHAGGRPALLTILHIALAPEGKELQVHASALSLDLGDFKGLERAPFAGRALQLEASAHPASVDGRTYYNLRRRAGVGYDYTPPGEQPHYLIAELELGSDESLSVRLLLPMGDLRMAGSVRQARAPANDPSYRIATASSEQLMDMLRSSNRDAMFPWTYGPFRRVTAGFTPAGLETDLHLARSLRLDPRLQALARTAKALAELGFADEALESARLALAIEASMSSDVLPPLDWLGGDRVEALGWIAQAQAIASDARGARATIDRTQGRAGFGPQCASPAFVGALARVGRVADAVALAEALQDPRRRTAALTEIALVQATTGDHAGAVRILHASGSAWDARSVAEALVRKGDLPGARQVLAEAAVLAADDSGTLLVVARAQMDAGDIDAARATARHAASVPAEARGLEEPGKARKDEVARQIAIAELQAELGDLDGARESFDRARQQVTGGASREPLSGAYVVALQLRLGDREAAKRTQEQVIATDYEWGAIVRAHIAIGDVPAAIAIAQQQGAWSLYEIAELQRRAGDRKGERETLGLALLALRAEIEKARERDRADPSPEAIADRALVHARAGDREAAALLTAVAADRARQRDEPATQVSALLGVAEVQVKAGDVRGARVTARDALARARNISTEGPSEFREKYGLLQLLLLPELKSRTAKE